jgi:hypothetical protein
MNELLKELSELLKKHNATILVEQEEEDTFLYLNVYKDEEKFCVDSGYRDLLISSEQLDRITIDE